MIWPETVMSLNALLNLRFAIVWPGYEWRFWGSRKYLSKWTISNSFLRQKPFKWTRSEIAACHWCSFILCWSVLEFGKIKLENSSLTNWIFSLQKSISKLNFVGYIASKNPVWNRLKIQFVELDFSKMIFQKSSLAVSYTLTVSGFALLNFFFSWT